MSIEHFDGKNAGGIKKLHMIRHMAATFDPSIALAPVITYSDDITTSENWTTILPIPNTASWNESETMEAGDAYRYSLDFIINKDRSAITEALKDKAKYKLLVLAEDHNGTLRLLGSDGSWCWMSFTQVKDPNLAGQNIYRVTITCEQPFPAVYYTGSYTSS